MGGRRGGPVLPGARRARRGGTAQRRHVAEAVRARELRLRRRADAPVRARLVQAHVPGSAPQQPPRLAATSSPPVRRRRLSRRRVAQRRVPRPPRGLFCAVRLRRDRPPRKGQHGRRGGAGSARAARSVGAVLRPPQTRDQGNAEVPRQPARGSPRPDGRAARRGRRPLGVDPGVGPVQDDGRDRRIGHAGTDRRRVARRAVRHTAGREHRAGGRGGQQPHTG